MYDQYKVNFKARMLQVSIDQSKMSFQASICLEIKSSKRQEFGFLNMFMIKA